MNTELKQLAYGFVPTLAVIAITAGVVHGASQNTSPAPGSFIAQAVQNDPGQGAGPGPFGGRGRFGGPGGPGRRGPGGPLDLPLGRLNLTDAQKDQVKAIMDSHQEDMRTIGDRERAAREALEQAIAAEPFNEATIVAKTSELSAVQADLNVMRARVRAEVLQILTAEQKAQAKETRPRR